MKPLKFQTETKERLNGVKMTQHQKTGQKREISSRVHERMKELLKDRNF